MRTISLSDIFFRANGKITTIVVLVLLLSGCMNYIFQPDKLFYYSPRELELDYYDVFLKTPDNIQIHGWFLKAKGAAKGTVFVLHGNAQNISSHVISVAWLPPSGYNVFIMDYRGYGDSTGYAAIPDVFLDIKTGLAWLIKNPAVQSRPIFLLGQSLGAALGVYLIGSDLDAKQQLTGVILDGSFSRYRTLAREKLSESWLTWLLQSSLPLLLSDKYDPEDYIAKISPLPILIMHSKDDAMVPFNYGKRLYEHAKNPKFFIETAGSHVGTFFYEQYRKDVLKFMSRAGGGIDEEVLYE
jgi:fermentation-respiration switch protein FrsA (DUF1100 family)